MSKILVIEDDAIFMNIFEKSLSSVGHSIVTAKCGEEGLTIFHNDIFDLVITDFNLGSITGLDVAKNIRKSNPNISIICVTGEINLDESGVFNLIIKKPFSIPELLKVVDKFLPPKRKNVS